MNLTGRFKAWFIAIFLVPLAIYTFYYYLGTRENRGEGKVEEIPQTYLEAGAPATTGRGIYQGGAGYKIAFHDTLKAGNNNMMPEPGLIFAVVPVLAPSPRVEGSYSWTLIDDSGRGYKPINTDSGRITNLKRLEEGDILPSTEADYLVFKVKTGIPFFYLKLLTDQNALYWRLPGS